VLAVIDSLKLDRPLLAGHSVAGEELSSIGSRVPDKVSGLIYLDAGYSYAFYDSSIGDFGLDLRDVRRKLERLEVGMLPQEARKVIQELLQDSLPAFERDLRTREKELASVPPLPLGAAPPPRPPFQDVAIMAGAQKYTNIPVPILAIFALPHMPPEALRNSPAALVEFHAQEENSIGKQAKAFESGLPSARVVRIPNADHYVFISNEVDVIRELNTFLKGPR
jgi:pimeloyl-ACP methyl ester carboxylesterase